MLVAQRQDVQHAALQSREVGRDAHLWRLFGSETVLLQHVIESQRRLGSAAQQAIAAHRERARDGTRHDESLAPLLERAVHGDQGARASARLDYQRAARESAYEAVAPGEAPGVGTLARRELGEKTAVLRHPLVERAVGGGIDHSEAVPQDGHSVSTGIQRGLVRHGVESPRQAARHHEPGPREPRREVAARLSAVAAVEPAPDDCHRLAL